jgi:hypothetical protein
LKIICPPGNETIDIYCSAMFMSKKCIGLRNFNVSNVQMNFSISFSIENSSETFQNLTSSMQVECGKSGKSS